MRGRGRRGEEREGEGRGGKKGRKIGNIRANTARKFGAPVMVESD